MRITIATGPCFPYPALRGGGMIRVWAALSPLFAGEGHEVTVFARENKGQAKEERVDGIRIIRKGGFPQSALTTLNIIRDFFYALSSCRHLPEADILVTNDFWMPILVPRLNKKAGLVVVSVNRFPKRQMALYRRASLLVTPTMALARAIEKQNPSLFQKTACIANPYDSDHFTHDSSIPPKPQSILYVGRLHPEKGVDILIRAFAKIHNYFPEATLSIVGPSKNAEGGGGSSYLNRLQSLAKDLPVSFRPPVYEAAELAAIYRKHSIFCYPTLADQGEAMGIAPIEAMACGCVPIVSSNPVFGDWLVSGQNGWSFNHRSQQDPAAELALRLHSLLENPGLLQKMQAICFGTVKKFSSPVIARKFLNHFESLLDEAD